MCSTIGDRPDEQTRISRRTSEIPRATLSSDAGSIERLRAGPVKNRIRSLMENSADKVESGKFRVVKGQERVSLPGLGDLLHLRNWTSAGVINASQQW